MNIRLPSILVLAACLVALAPTAGGAEQPAGDRVLMLVGGEFNGQEFWFPYLALRATGYTVDVASYTTEPLAPDNARGDRDNVTPDLLMKDVDPSRYVGLVLPGGRGPEKLEKHAEALEISRAFMERERPVAAICHGPRLLGQAGALEGRIATGLWMIADELPDYWMSERRGAYVDEPVVIDRNLITSRWPRDLGPFMRAMLRKLAANDGIRLPETNPRVLFVDVGADAHLQWGMTHGLAAQNIDVAQVRVKPGRADKAKLPDGEFDVLVIAPDAKFTEGAKDVEKLHGLLSRFAQKGPQRIVRIGEDHSVRVEPSPESDPERKAGSVGAALRVVAELAHRHGETRAEQREAEPATAAIALMPSFDGRAAAAAKALLEYEGRRVAILAPDAGWVRGQAGLPFRADGAYADPPPLADGAVIVAPGGVWSKCDADATRLEWLMSRYEAGDVLLAVGMDSRRLANFSETFKGKSFASTAQAAWFMHPARYVDAPAVVSAERLVTARGADALPEAIKLLDKLTAAAKD